MVSDSGSGIPADIRDKIFDPFFTTKLTDRKRGSGLGLSIVQAIVADHHGYLDLETRIGVGTSFSVYLPTSAPESRDGSSPRSGCGEPPSSRPLGPVWQRDS